MPTDANREADRSQTNRRRYRYIEYDGRTVSIIRDSENHNAWILSTLSVDVTR